MNNEDRILSLLEKLVSEVTELKAGQAKLEAGQAKLEASQAKLEAGQAELEAGQAELKGDIFRIEHTHGQKLDALFDGYKQLSNKLDRIEEHVSKQDDDILRRVFPQTLNQ